MSGIDDRTALEADPMGWNDQGLFGVMGEVLQSEGCLGRGRGAWAEGRTRVD